LSKNKKSRPSKNKTIDPWVIKVAVVTFIISFLISLLSESLMNKVGIVLAFVILLIIVLIGIIFDIIGISVASANETPFHSMAADKVKGGKEAVRLIRNADIVANFCNDVVGDISGIISGAAGAVIAIKIINYGIELSVLGMVMSSLIATITVGGKAIGKGIALNNSRIIVHKVALVMEIIERRLKVNLLSTTNGKRVRK
jgi:CBS domain containing-hemolysin-like protein